MLCLQWTSWLKLFGFSNENRVAALHVWCRRGKSFAVILANFSNTLFFASICARVWCIEGCVVVGGGGGGDDFPYGSFVKIQGFHGVYSFKGV